MDKRITLRVGDADSDPQHIDDLTRLLRQELLDLDVAVESAKGGQVPLGAKSIEVAAIGTLIVTLSQSPVLAALVTAVANWLGQRRERTVSLEVDGDPVELSGLPSSEERDRAKAWVSRHATTDEGGLGNRHALIVANYDYVDPGLSGLRAPAHDAEQLAGVLRDPKIGGFEVRTLLNESAATINEAVEDFFADRDPEELLLLHFSGHGVKDEAGELYFAAATTKLHRLGATGVSADFVSRRMNRSRSRRIVLLLDCCYAGAFGRGMVARAGSSIAIEEQFGGRGRAIITASSAMEYAFEGQELADARDEGPSVFTSALVEGLDTGDADRDQDGFVGLDELYDYVYERVRRSTPNQTPGKWTFDLQGDLHIARRGKPVSKPAPLPHELQEAIAHPLSGMREGAVGELERLLNRRHEGLALAAKLALRRLVDDDSRLVSTAAAKALGVAEPAVPRAVQPPPLKVEKPVAPKEAAPEETPPPAPKPKPVAPLWTSPVVRVLAALSAATLAIAFSYRLQDDLTYPLMPFHVTVWLWALVGAALVLVCAPAGHRAREVSHGIALGAAATLLGVLVSVKFTSDWTYATTGLWLSVIGVFLIVLAVTADVLDRFALTRLAGTAVALSAITIHLFVPDAATNSGEEHWFWFEVLAVGALGVVIALRRNGRWQERAAWTGAAVCALLLADALWAITDEDMVRTSTVFLPALVVVLLADVLIGDDRPVPLAVTRLSVVLGLLLHSPQYSARSDAAPSTFVHVLLEVAAAGFALAALWSPSSPRRAVP